MRVVLALLLSVGTIVKSNASSPKCDSKCICERNGTDVTVTCTNRNVLSLNNLQIPEDVTVLRVGGNKVRNIPNDSLRQFSMLRELDLSFMVDADDHSFAVYLNSFRGLESLKVLNMEKVAESLDISCKSKPFRHLKSLQELRMRMVRASHPSCLNRAFYDLRQLKYLSFRIDNYHIPQSLASMKDLRVLDLAGSKFQSMDRETFNVLHNISVKVLSLRGVQFDTVDPLALLPVAHSLQALEYSCPLTKNTNPDLFAPILPSFQNSTVLRVLNLDGVYERTDGCLKLQDNQFKPLHHVPLVSLSIRDNSLTTMRRFYRYILSVKYLNIDYNPVHIRDAPDNNFYLKLLFATKYQTFSASHLTLDNKPNVCSADVNWEFWKQVKSVEHTEEQENVVSTTSYLKNKYPLQTLIISHLNGLEFTYSTKGPMNVSKPYTDDHGLIKIFLDFSALTTVVLSYLNIRRLDWPVYGLIGVKYLNLEHNNLEFVHSGFFRDFPSLQTLQLASNRFGLFTNESYLEAIFSNLPSIRKIDLADNLLTTVPKAMFSNCTSLVTLNLRYNPLVTFEFDFSLFPQISYVDVGDCKIQEFKAYQVKFFKTSSFLKVNVSGLDELDCHNCGNKEFYEMIQKNKSLADLEGKQELACTRDGVRVKLAHLGLSSLEFSCMYEIFVILCVTVVSAILISVVIVLYCRWNIKYLVHLTKRKLKNRGNPQANALYYDVYLSFSEDDRDTAFQLFTGLNNCGLEVFYWPRNSRPGTCQFEEIFEQMGLCKKIVILITASTENSAMQNFEIRMSLPRGKGFVIPIVKEDYVIGKLPGPIKNLLRQDLFFLWPEQEKDQEMFYRNVKRAARSKDGVVFWRKGCLAYYG